MNLGQFSRAIKGYSDRIHQQLKMTDNLNLLLGSYIRTAIHNPKKFPTEPALSKSDKSHKPIAATTDNQRIAYVAALYGKKKV